MSELQGKVAVITGGNSGIGLATAQRFVDEGARVVILGRDAESLEAAVAQLGDSGHGVQGNVTEAADLDRLFAETLERFGKIDVVFANAGVAPHEPFASYSEETFDTVFDVNVKGVFFTVQKALDHLNDGASIIITGSVASRVGLEGFSAYSATKAAVRSLARSLSAELKERGIRVNVISPGPIETPLFSRTGLSEQEIEEFAAGVVSQVPAGRFGKADEIANAALYLASARSSYVVGSELVVDGGMTEV